MEKITIGKFIAALRRANGMTQRELGEKLFVSDKTVSRWECDECTPDLSLIPTIAEIFGITTDELLRGERNNYERERSCDESSGKQKAKRDKQFRLMLDINKRKYKNLTLISFGITILGFIFAMVANLGFSEGLIAFCFTAAFCAASEICQICFAVNARILPDDDDAEYAEKIEKVNTGIAETVVKFTFFNIAVLAFSLPLVTLINGANYGMLFESWLVYGLLFSAIAFVLSFVLYMFSVHKMLCDRGIIIISQDEAKTVSENKALVKKIIAISVSVAILLCIGNIVLQEMLRFYQCR